MDGLQLANNIRKLDNEHEYKIVLISAEENFHNNYDNKFDEIYNKPMNISNFVKIYNEY